MRDLVVRARGGDRDDFWCIAIEVQGEGHLAISTFAPDGSDITNVIEGGRSAFWSPDGTKVADLRPHDGPRPGLAIANADGSDVREIRGSGALASGHARDRRRRASVQTACVARTPLNHFVVGAAIALTVLAGCTAAAPSAAPTVGTVSTPAAEATVGATQTPALADTASPAATQAARPLPTAEDVAPGRYFLEFGGYRFTFTIAHPGWNADVDAGGVYTGDDNELAIFWPGGNVTSLYGRACESSGTEFEPGPTVDDLADALGSLEDFDVTAPADVTVGGFEGKRVAISVPTDVDVDSSACDRGNYSLSEGRWYQAPGQTDDMRILSLGGERQVVTTSTTPATPGDVSAQLDEMLESLLIEPR